MQRRQTATPRQWLIVDTRNAADLPGILRRLPRGSGILVLAADLPGRARRALLLRLRRQARARGWLVVDRLSSAARVHDARELRRALLAGPDLILLSPLYATRSHPEWMALPRMRAAALARLARKRTIALGGMDERRFRTVEGLGFVGWAGIDAWMIAERPSRE